MQISIETTTQSTSILSASFGNSALNTADDKSSGGAPSKSDTTEAPALSILEAASKQAEEDAAVIATLRQAVEDGRNEDEDGGNETALATIEDYQKTAGQLKSALGEDDPAGNVSVAYESATISTTTIEAEIGGETLTAEFVSFERVSFDNETGLSVRSASAASIDGEFGNGSFSYESASVSQLYAGTGEQFANLTGLTA
ncbi:hypothetical protein E1180_06370 [Roseibium denhamense]|uniref:Uncharacterized protein n=1 Tax=Roseibium denhamense TaxID=76305 RepID=A0ABY1NZ11_9HYPH|nr:hypothetical protein [Roseibium denhamense]MTI05137.1 hypothetical protein [Roseibium denhamense]SMP22464.1 hypothetical protein SAMN06265374_2180 [Roseibium denhamense]